MAIERQSRRRRAHGEVSRRKILDAAVEVAAERGYDGTTIAQVSKKCGLPASSIYWHFKDKDELIAAVIERSFASWLDAWTIRGDGSVRENLIDMTVQIAKALLDSPDFIRLGLMLSLERRPVEPSARTIFVAVRAEARNRIIEALHQFMPALDDAHVELLTTYAMAGADGLFIAHEIEGDSVDLIETFTFHANVLFDAATRLQEKTKSDPGQTSGRRDKSST